MTETITIALFLYLSETLGSYSCTQNVICNYDNVIVIMAISDCINKYIFIWKSLIAIS